MNTRTRIYRKWKVRDIYFTGLRRVVDMQVLRYQNYANMVLTLRQALIDNVSKL